MTKIHPRYFIVCLLSASMWASLGRESKAASTDNRADELANLNHQVKKLEIANGNLRSKIESLNDALVNLGKVRNTLEDKLEEEEDVGDIENFEGMEPK